MKRSKRIGVLLGVLVLCCIAAFGVTRIQEKQEQIQTSEAVVLSIPEEQVEKLSWRTEDTDLSFYRDENSSWSYYNDPAFPVDDEIIGDMLALFEDFSVTFIIENVEDFSQYGLDEPVGTIELTAQETAYTIQLGSFSKMDEQRYVSIGDGNVYLVSKDPLDTYDAELPDVIDHDEVPVFEMVERIAFTGEESYSLVHQEDAAASYCTEDVYFWGKKSADTENVELYLENLTWMDLTDYVTYNATKEELADCGLAEPALSVTVDYSVENEDESTTANTFTIHVGLVSGETDEETGEVITTAYARVGDSPIIYRLAEDDEASVLAYTYNDLRHQEVFTADFATVSGLDITLEHATYHLTATVVTDEESEEETILWTYAGEELDITAIQSALEALSADSFTGDASSGQEEIALTIHLANDHAATMEIALYRVDGTHCLCEVNGEPISLILRSSVVDLVEAVNAIVLN